MQQTTTAATDWEAAARTQAARGDYLENVLRRVLDIAGAVEHPSIDKRDDRLACEDCDTRGWAEDGFEVGEHMTFCATCADGGPRP